MKQIQKIEVLFMNKFYCWMSLLNKKFKFPMLKFRSNFINKWDHLIWMVWSMILSKVEFEEEKREFDWINSGQLKRYL